MKRSIKVIAAILVFSLFIGVAEPATALYESEEAYNIARYSTTDWTPVKVNGVTLPLSGFGSGKYFTTNNSACNHEKNIKYCREFGTGIYAGSQCAGFANYVYKQIWGSQSAGHHEWIDACISIQTESAAKEFFTTKVEPGAQIRTRKSPTSDKKHSFIVVEVESDRVRIYDANSNGNDCGTGMRWYTYSDIGISYPYVWWYRTAEHHTPVSLGSQGHRVCSSDVCDGYDTVQPHVKEGVPGYGKCVVCNYYGNISTGTLDLKPCIK